MKMQELANDEMYCLVAPDGTPQLSTLAPDYALCIGFCAALSSVGMTKHPATLFEEGFVILPVKVTIIQTGNQEDAFQAGKKENG